MSESLISSFLVSDVSELLRLLTKNEQCERIPQVAHQKWVTMSDLLRSLTKNERMSESLIFWVNPSIAHFWENTSDSLENPMSKFPALATCTVYSVQ